MAMESFSRADEIAAARKRGGGVGGGGATALPLRDITTRRRLSMQDPQLQRVRAMELPVLEREPVAGPLGEQGAAAGADAKPAGPSPEEQARLIIAEARETARTMLAQAREAIATEREQVLAAARAAGHAEGLAKADDETAGLLDTCEKIGIHVMEERQRVLAESEADIVELAMAIARRIVNASVDVDETLVVDACRGAMRKAFQRGSIQVLAHPDDLVLLRESGPKLAAELGGVEHLDFIEERRLTRGSVIVRTPAGEIDGTIDGKSAKIEQTLREGIEQRRAERASSGAASAASAD